HDLWIARTKQDDEPAMTKSYTEMTETMAGRPAAPHSALVTRRPEAGRARVRAWITQALGAGWRVYAEQAHPDADSQAELAVLTGSSAIATGQAQVLPAETVHAETGGKHAALTEWHTDLLESTYRQGYAGLAILCD